jgi:hypothetical protein
MPCDDCEIAHYNLKSINVGHVDRLDVQSHDVNGSYWIEHNCYNSDNKLIFTFRCYPNKYFTVDVEEGIIDIPSN